MSNQTIHIQEAIQPIEIIKRPRGRPKKNTSNRKRKRPQGRPPKHKPPKEKNNHEEYLEFMKSVQYLNPKILIILRNTMRK